MQKQELGGSIASMHKKQVLSWIIFGVVNVAVVLAVACGGNGGNGGNGGACTGGGNDCKAGNGGAGGNGTGPVTSVPVSASVPVTIP